MWVFLEISNTKTVKTSKFMQNTLNAIILTLELC